MANLETRDFLGIMDCHYLHSSSSTSSSSPSSSLHLSLRATESDFSNSAERVCEEEEVTTSDAAMNDTKTTFKRKRSGADQTLLLHAGNVNVNGYQNISPLDVLMPELLRDSITLPKIPLKRKASLIRFFQMRDERVQNLQLNGRNSSSDRSATFLQLMSERKSEAIPPDTEFEFEFYVPSLKRQYPQSLEAQ